MANDSTEKTPKTSGRSPAFPYIDVGKAIELIQKINKENRGQPVSVEVAFAQIGISHKSGPGRRTLAALKAFGLIQVKGGKLHLTPLAHRIVDDERPGSKERQEALEEAALNPAIHARLWTKYRDKPPADAEVKHHLVWEEGFNKASVDDFLGEYKRTLDYAKVGKPSTPEEAGEGAPPQIATGDLVHWQSQGVDQFAEPRRVRGVQEKDGEAWVFVEGSETGILASEVTVVKKAPKAMTMPETPPAKTPPLMPLPVEHADTYLLTIPFKGKPLSVRVHLPGETLGSEHFAKIKAHLELLIDDPAGKPN